MTKLGTPIGAGPKRARVVLGLARVGEPSALKGAGGWGGVPPSLPFVPSGAFRVEFCGAPFPSVSFCWRPPSAVVLSPPMPEFVVLPPLPPLGAEPPPPVVPVGPVGAVGSGVAGTGSGTGTGALYSLVATELVQPGSARSIRPSPSSSAPLAQTGSGTSTEPAPGTLTCFAPAA